MCFFAVIILFPLPGNESNMNIKKKILKNIDLIHNIDKFNNFLYVGLFMGSYHKDVLINFVRTLHVYIVSNDLFFFHKTEVTWNIHIPYILFWIDLNI